MKKYTKIIVTILSFVILFTGCNTNANESSKQNYKENITQINNEKENVSDDKCRVDILDVGQGSSTLIEAGGEYMLIDGGDSNKSSYVVSYLKKRNISTLKYVVATHYDSDHLNGIVGAINVFEVENIFAPEYTETTRVYNSFVKRLDKINIKKSCPKIGSTYSLGEAQFTIIAPNSKGYSNVNDYSIGIKFTYYNNSFIVCGDATNVSESEILANGINLKSDLYIVNHHGSSTSTKQSFLNAINPKYAVISVGTGNSYGHPAKSTLKKLLDRNIDIYRTDKQREISFSMDGNEILFNLKPYNKLEEGNDFKNGSDINFGTETKPINKDNENVYYILNSSSKKIHKSECNAVKKMSENNKIYFKGSVGEAIGQGYLKCKNCFND